MGKAYTLKLYNTPLLEFEFVKLEFGEPAVKILDIKEEHKKLFPINLELSDEGLFSWLKNRAIPKNREFVHRILQSLDLTINDTEGIIDICKGLSLNDSYWILPFDSELIFEDYNLYENPFSEALSLVAYTGIYSDNRKNFTTSPELTTNGMLAKAWRNKEDGIYLYKCGTEGFANSGLEPYSEYYASQIAAKMGLKHVSYDLEKWKGRLASTCLLFTDIDTAYVPIGHVCRTGGLAACQKFCKSISDEAVQDMNNMLVFDALIYNTDRHFGNFGLLRNNHTGEFTAFAPVFDNGLSLFCYAMKSDLANIDSYKKTLDNPYGVSYPEICSHVMGSSQRAALRKMLDFTFERHPLHNLPEQRLEIIEDEIHKRAKELLEVESSAVEL